MRTVLPYRGKRVLVFGLGALHGGVATAQFFVRQGARVRITDRKPASALHASLRALARTPCTLVLGRHRQEDIRWAEIIVVNPDVPFRSPFLSLARKLGKRIENDASIFFQHCSVPIVGVTGTKGKTTTAACIATVLRGRFRPVLVGWNDRGVLDALQKVRKKSVAIFELSSFRIEGLGLHRQSPAVAIMTNFFADHLNRYGSLAAYRRAKALLLYYQRAGDLAVLNRDDPGARSFATVGNAKRMWYSAEGRDRAQVTLRGKSIVLRWGRRKTQRIPFPRAKTLSPQARSAALAAAAVGMHFGIPGFVIARALSHLPAVRGRQEVIRRVKGVTYINDTTATVPEATIAALKNIRNPIVLIAGGSDKRLSYRSFAEILPKVVRYLIVFPGSATEKIQRILEKKRTRLRPSVAGSMRDAIAKARSLARSGDVVLLSPGAASFGLFRNEFDRGAQFIHEVRKL